MVTHIFDEYELKPVQRHPANNMLMMAFEVNGEETFVWPLNDEGAEQLWVNLGEALGKTGIKPATMEDLKRATSTRPGR